MSAGCLDRSFLGRRWVGSTRRNQPGVGDTGDPEHHRGDRGPRSLRSDIVNPLLSRPAAASPAALCCNTIFSCRNCFLLSEIQEQPFLVAGGGKLFWGRQDTSITAQAYADFPGAHRSPEAPLARPGLITSLLCLRSTLPPPLPLENPID